MIKPMETEAHEAQKEKISAPPEVMEKIYKHAVLEFEKNKQKNVKLISTPCLRYGKQTCEKGNNG